MDSVPSSEFTESPTYAHSNSTNGSAFNAVPFVPLGGSDVTNVGTMRLRFSDGNNGTLTYTYLGTSVTKAITRQVFSDPVTVCR